MRVSASLYGWNPVSVKPKPLYSQNGLNIPVIVEYKDESAELEILTYNTYTEKFCYDQKDFTDEVKMWRHIPYRYDPDCKIDEIGCDKCPRCIKCVSYADRLLDRTTESLTLTEAFIAAEIYGCFVSCNSFSSDQSMHYYKGDFYYEDGAVVTPEFLYNQEFAQREEWFIKAFPDEVNVETLKKVHQEAGKYTLSALKGNRTYEEAIEKKGEKYGS